MRTLAGIELDGNRLCIAVVRQTKRGVRPLRVVELSLDTPIAELRQEIRELGLPREITLSVADDGLFQNDHLLAELPPARPKHLNRLVERRIRAELPEGWGDIVISSERLANGHVLAASIRNDAAERALQTIERLGIRPSRVVTPVVALQAFAAHRDGAVGVVHVGQTKLSVLVASEGSIVFAREALSVDASEEALSPVERRVANFDTDRPIQTAYVMARDLWARHIVREVEGTLRYLSQSHRVEVAKLVVSGDRDRAPRVAAMLTSSLGIPAETVAEANAVGAALATRSSIDLAPARRKEARSARQLLALCVVLAVGVGAGTPLLLDQVDRKTRTAVSEYATVQRQVDSLAPIVEAKKADTAQRLWATNASAAVASYDNEIRGLQTTLVQFARATTGATMRTLELRDGHLLATGEIRGADLDAIEERFRATKTALEGVPGWADVRIKPLKMDGQTTLHFELRADIHAWQQADIERARAVRKDAS